MLTGKGTKGLALVYLARGKGAGLAPVSRFVDAYKSFDAGCPHKLYVIMKGWSRETEDDKGQVVGLFESLEAEIIEFKDDGFDWGAYIRFSRLVESDFYCFLNTFSRPLTDNWLSFLFSCIQKEDVGLCGASGSTIGWRFRLPLINLKSFDIFLTPLRIFVRAFWHFRHGKRYPENFSPHIRSNGFVVKGNQFRKFSTMARFPKTKLDTYHLESGSDSYSNYIMKLDQRLVIVDSLGGEHEIKDWANSNTYCCPSQENLIIADNSTDLYSQKTRTQRQRMEHDTWGKTITR